MLEFVNAAAFSACDFAWKPTTPNLRCSRAHRVSFSVNAASKWSRLR